MGGYLLRLMINKPTMFKNQVTMFKNLLCLRVIKKEDQSH